MRLRETRLAIGILTFVVVLACRNEVKVPSTASIPLDSGNCAGCLLGAEEGLWSTVVRTDGDYKTLVESCFLEQIRREWLPPQPGAEEVLVYVSLRGGGCEWCFDIVNIRETPRNIVVEVHGSFQGLCDMLIVPGAWALIPETDKRITFQFREEECSNEK